MANEWAGIKPRYTSAKYSADWTKYNCVSNMPAKYTGCPFWIGDEIYGTYTHPYNRFTMTAQSGANSKYRGVVDMSYGGTGFTLYAYRLCVRQTENEIMGQIPTVLLHSIDGDFTNTTALTLSGDYVHADITKYDNIKIGGKYRLKGTYGTASSKNFKFECKISVDGVTYDYMLIGGRSIVLYKLNSETHTVETVIKYVDESIGTVLDFGELPQDAPSFMSSWLDEVATPIYSNEYIIKSYSGDITLAEFNEAPPMVNAFLNVVGNQKSLTLTGSNGELYTKVWESETPEGQIFLGLSTMPNSNRPTLLANNDVAVSWVGNLVFYESYGKYRPPTTAFDINLYQNSAEANRVDKGNYLVGVGTLSGALRDECSLLTPSIVYQSADVPSFNYVYIPIFNRYYFVTSLSSVSKNVWRMELNCDVLMTYKNEILLLQGVVGRQEIDFNPLLVDNELPTQNNPIVEVIDIPSDAFNTQASAEHNFLLTVIGA